MVFSSIVIVYVKADRGIKKEGCEVGTVHKSVSKDKGWRKMKIGGRVCNRRVAWTRVNLEAPRYSK